MESFGEQMAFKLGLHLFMAYPRIDMGVIGCARTSIERFYKAEDIHALLEQAQTVIRFKAIGDRWGNWEQLNALNGDLAEQEGILIGIKPVQKDTPEKFLQDFLCAMSGDTDLHHWQERAKKLLK